MLRHMLTKNILDRDESNVLLVHLLHTDRRQDLADNTSRDIANFSLKISLPWQPRSVVVEFDSHRSIARPRKPPDRHKDLGDISHTT